ncbi:Arylsulfatase B [Paramuricea clavata]|uniref:Arylsulfatase B n=1 Tax=Paramuricea clavata TaxID=317549 RepID=A0A7D9DEK3_PARCT|nr:Arylsulfatase B [Paramuricea clavata]
MEKILEELGLGTLKQRFAEERIEPEIVLAMTDGELTHLGVSTMGDRIRLRQICRVSISTQSAEQSNVNSEGSESSLNSSGGPSSASSSAFVASERSRLFNPRHSRTTSRKRKATRGRTWTAQILCLADRQQTKIPNSIEKQILRNAGLGLKKIKFEVSDNAQQVVDTIMSDEKADNDEPIGFPQLRQSGGFELLRCLPNCRELRMIDCPWTVRNLKATLGSQSKIYARPIQRNFQLVREKCQGCQEDFMLSEHLYTCTAGILNSDLSDENDFNQPQQIQPTNAAAHMDINSEQHTTLGDIFEHQTTIADQQPSDSAEQLTSNNETPQAEDYGGPRREFFRLVLQAIKDKYFDHGLRELLSDEYEIVGTNNNGIISKRKDKTFAGKIIKICSQMPSMQDVFGYSPSSVLTIRKLNALLAPQFSPTGSNRRHYEGAVYYQFCKYVREVAGGRRGDVTLGHILQFATASDEEPYWGSR